MWLEGGVIRQPMLRLSVNKIGNAILTAARVRPKFIGGSRAVYDENLM